MLHLLRYQHSCANDNDNDDSQNDNKSLVQAMWHPVLTNCVGIINDSGVFEYKDIYTQKTVSYQLCNNNNNNTNTNQRTKNNTTQPLFTKCIHPWIEFNFVKQCPYKICFVLENSTVLYETQFVDKSEIEVDFPNFVESNMVHISFTVETVIECHANIDCFSIGHQSEIVCCGLSNGDVSICSRSQRCQLSMITQANQSPITSILCLVNAFITGGNDQSLYIWDIKNARPTKTNHNNNNNTNHKVSLLLLQKFEIACSSVTVLHAFRVCHSEEEVLCAGTSDGTLFVYSFNKLELIIVIHLQPSECLTLSAISDGSILICGQLNGNTTLLSTDGWTCVGSQVFAEHPVVCAQYNTFTNVDNDVITDDLLVMASNSCEKLYLSHKKHKKGNAHSNRNRNTREDGNNHNNNGQETQRQSIPTSAPNAMNMYITPDSSALRRDVMTNSNHSQSQSQSQFNASSTNTFQVSPNLSNNYQKMPFNTTHSSNTSTPITTSTSISAQQQQTHPNAFSESDDDDDSADNNGGSDTKTDPISTPSHSQPANRNTPAFLRNTTVSSSNVYWKRHGHGQPPRTDDDSSNVSSLVSSIGNLALTDITANTKNRAQKPPASPLQPQPQAQSQPRSTDLHRRNTGKRSHQRRIINYNKNKAILELVSTQHQSEMSSVLQSNTNTNTITRSSNSSSYGSHKEIENRNINILYDDGDGHGNTNERKGGGGGVVRHGQPSVHTQYIQHQIKHMQNTTFDINSEAMQERVQQQLQSKNKVYRKELQNILQNEGKKIDDGKESATTTTQAFADLPPISKLNVFETARQSYRKVQESRVQKNSQLLKQMQTKKNESRDLFRIGDGSGGANSNSNNPNGDSNGKLGTVNAMDEPLSMKHYYHRSLEPEHRIRYNKSTNTSRETFHKKKSLSFSNRMKSWSRSRFNQRI